MNRRTVIIVITAAVCVCLLIGFVLRRPMPSSRRGAVAQTGSIWYEEARRRAFEMIEHREQWPESPEAVCQAFWHARAAKDYAEMEVLWPGSASFNWPQMCKDDPKVEYVFGQADAGGTTIPYAAKDHFDSQGTYNLTMRLGVLQTERGSRCYIVSGN